MPVKKVKGGYKVENTTTKKPMTKEEAEAQHRAIKATQARRSKNMARKAAPKRSAK